jgi:hypothetical protein
MSGTQRGWWRVTVKLSVVGLHMLHSGFDLLVVCNVELDDFNICLDTQFFEFLRCFLP